jgi:hypothetical protein
MKLAGEKPTRNFLKTGYSELLAVAGVMKGPIWV